MRRGYFDISAEFLAAWLRLPAGSVVVDIHWAHANDVFTVIVESPDLPEVPPKHFITQVQPEFTDNNGPKFVCWGIEELPKPFERHVAEWNMETRQRMKEKERNAAVLGGDYAVGESMN